MMLQRHAHCGYQAGASQYVSEIALGCGHHGASEHCECARRPQNLGTRLLTFARGAAVQRLAVPLEEH